MAQSATLPQKRRKTRAQANRLLKAVSDKPTAVSVDELEPLESARAAGLRYVSDLSPGIVRRRVGRGFTYIDPNGRRVRNREELARIRSLAIPPAWTNVWISPNARGHIQATGRDARGRKQYRYHPQWRRIRDETKYHKITAFGEALPAIRERVSADLSKEGLPREKVLAAVIRILDTTLLRVGNQEYARVNDSFGLTTLQDRHVNIDGSELRFRFKGKGGKVHGVAVEDRRLARIVKRCQDLPGEELFQYVDDDGEQRTIESGDVNDYLREISGDEFSAKDFRTWGGTVLAAEALVRRGEFSNPTEAKSNVVQAIKDVAEELNNTPAVCRSSYIHPEVIESYLDGSLVGIWREAEESVKDWIEGLRREEAILLVVLKNRLHAKAGTKAS
ncbi:MAG TPA: DNA topoisomerase IB [Actinomycetota bacterium]|nr:DNA topoisomerase IB [Actinomycetota bacterium]